MANILRKMKNDRKNTIMLRDITQELNFTGGIDSSFPIHKCLELKFILKLTHFNPVYSILLANFLIGLDSCDTIQGNKRENFQVIKK